MNQRLLCLGLLIPMAVVCAGVNGAWAQANDMFPTRVAAEKRAKELKCSGTFAMGGAWMPCRDLNTYERVVQQES